MDLLVCFGTDGADRFSTTCLRGQGSGGFTDACFRSQGSGDFTVGGFAAERRIFGCLGTEPSAFAADPHSTRSGFHSLLLRASQMLYDALRAASLNFFNISLTFLGESPRDFRQYGTEVELNPLAPTSIANK